jgi:DNA-binding MarR family transcriptional regulator
MDEHGIERRDTSKLVDALTFLCSQQRTGKIRIQSGGEEGVVYLVEGRITHAQFDQGIGLQALFFMVSWERGMFQFTPKEITDYVTIEMETSRLLPLLVKRERAWKMINKETPLTLDTILSLLPQASGAIRLKKEEWDILARIDGKKSLRQISNEMFLAPLDVVKAIMRFREAGLIGESARIRDHEEIHNVLGKDFLSALERELQMAQGPVAPILLEDALTDLGETVESLTPGKGKLLLERLSEAISVEKQRSRFQEAARTLLLEFSKNKKGKDRAKE